MADEVMSTVIGQNIIRAGSEFIRDSHKLVRTLAVGGNTAKVGMIMTAASETWPAVDIVADGDLGFEGILLRPVARPSDTWTLDTALTDATDVVLLKPTGGQVKIAIWVTGMTGATAISAGDPIYVQDFTPDVLASANITLGAGMHVGALDVNLDSTANITHPLVKIGTVAADYASGGDATSAVAGRLIWIWY